MAAFSNRAPRWLMPALTLLLAAGLPATVVAQARGGAAPSENKQMLEELKVIRQLLEKLVALQSAPSAARPAGAPVTLTLQPTDHAIGDAAAPLTMVEFTDLQCPFCRQFHVETFDRLKREYIDTGKVRYITRDLPLTNIHTLAQSAARVSGCAGDQNRFWEMRHAILVNNGALKAEMFVAFAQDLGLDVARLITCTNDTSRIDALISADANSARSVGLEGTPVFIIGRTEGSTLKGEPIEGAQPYDTFDGRIKALLAPR